MTSPAPNESPTHFGVTFTLTPQAPGTPDTITCWEDSVRLSHTVGLVNAVQRAGWLAFVYGECTITNDANGNTFTVSVTDKST